MKLSTTKMLCVGPTPRQNAVGIPGGSWRTYSTRMLGKCVGRLGRAVHGIHIEAPHHGDEVVEAGCAHHP